MNKEEKETKENSNQRLNETLISLVKVSFLKNSLAIAAVFLIAAVGSAGAHCNQTANPTTCYGCCYVNDTGPNHDDCIWCYVCEDTVGLTNNATKTCVFDENLTCSDKTKLGLIVGANNIVIDGAGYSMAGNENAAACDCAGEGDPATHTGIVNVNGYDNVVIKNLEIEKFCTGIVLAGAGANWVTNNTVSQCSIHDNGNSTCSDCEETSTHGIHLSAIERSNITGNDIYNNKGTGSSCSAGGNGIFVYALGASYNNITYNNLHNNIKSGFFMKMKPHHNNISHNNATGNGRGGIILMCKLSNYNTIEGNNASKNHGNGISIGGRNNTIRNNSVFNNGLIGINMGRSDGSYNNKLYENTVCGNEHTDIKTCGLECYGNHGDENTCDTTFNYDDEGTSGCTYSCGILPAVPLFVQGWICYENGTACTGPDVDITNMDTDECWHAETSATLNYYRLVLDSDDVSDGNMLWFNVSKGDQTKTVEHTVTQAEINAGGIFDFNISFEAELPAIFDTGEGTYPSISGTHNGTITPAQNTTVNRLYTYACTGTGGHTEYVRIWNESENVDGKGNWSGYPGDYHNVTISPALTLLQGHTYNYTIKTGSYPQIVHAKSKSVTGGNITCTKFTDANGKEYEDGIPAIRLFYEGQ